MPLAFSMPRSDYIKGLEWLGERVSYPDPEIKGDTFPLTWADDGELYASAGDPLWGETIDGLDVERFSGHPPDYRISKANHMNEYVGTGGAGPKPTGMLCVDGVLYLAFQNLLGQRRPAFGVLSQHGSDAQIIYSPNKGISWIPQRSEITAPMFPGNKFGGPAFVNFGCNNANARDDYVYAISTEQWDNGSNVRLGRAPKESIMRREAWEWVCAFGTAGEPAWSNELEAAVPVLSMHRHISLPEMAYLAGINRYLLLTWHLHKDFSGDDGSDLLVFEAPEPWGPIALVHFEEYWEGKEFTPYCPRIPLKWLEPDGITGWLLFSGSWSQAGQKAGYYRAHVRRFRLKMR